MCWKCRGERSAVIAKAELGRTTDLGRFDRQGGGGPGESLRGLRVTLSTLRKLMGILGESVASELASEDCIVSEKSDQQAPVYCAE